MNPTERSMPPAMMIGTETHADVRHVVFSHIPFAQHRFARIAGPVKLTFKEGREWQSLFLISRPLSHQH